MSQMRMVLLHGPAAAGKLTVARALGQLTGFPVFHNHLVVDTLLEVFPFGSPEFVDLRERFWLQTFEAAARSGRSLIFTFSPEDTVKPGFSDQVIRVVQGNGGLVHFVELRVSDAEQERRIENPDRKQFQKLSSRVKLRTLSLQNHGPMDVPPTELSIDTETMSPGAAAAAIRDAFDLKSSTELRGYRD